MDNSQFVLMASVFIVITTVMVTLSAWDKAPAPLPALFGYDCVFDGFCQGNDCAAALPSDFTLLPETEDSRAYFYYADAPDTRYALQTVRAKEWVAGLGSGGGVVRLLLRNSGALKYSQHEGPESESPILAHGSAICREASDIGHRNFEGTNG